MSQCVYVRLTQQTNSAYFLGVFLLIFMQLLIYDNMLTDYIDVIYCLSFQQPHFCISKSDIIRMIRSEDLLNKTVRGYHFKKELGQGQHGKVYEVYHGKKNITAAAKVMCKANLTENPKLLELVQNQKKILKSVHNQNVVRYIDDFTTAKSLVIVMELCNQGELQNYLNKKEGRRISEAEATHFLKQIINGFKGLHQVRAMHRDFKTANVLLHNGVCKIADLGFSKQFKASTDKIITHTVLGTGLTLAPEILDSRPYGLKADLWSVGVVYYQLIYGKYPFHAMHTNQILQLIKKGVKFEGVQISNEARDFISRCLVMDVSKRMSWEQLYNHILIKTPSKILMVPAEEEPLNEEKLEENKMFYSRTEVKEEEEVYKEDRNGEEKLEKPVVLKEVMEVEEEIIPMQPQVEEECHKINVLSNNEQLKISTYQQPKINKYQQKTKLNIYQEMYMNYYNRIMFASKYIIPHYHHFQPYVHTIHQIPLFILAKKAYLDISSFSEFLTTYNNFTNIPSSQFTQFISSNAYEAIMQSTFSDIDNLTMSAIIYKSEIPIQQIDKNEALYNIESPWSKQYWQKLLEDKIKGYEYLLIQHLSEVKANKVALNVMTQVIEALHYYYKQDAHSNLYQFQKHIENLDYEEARKQQKKRWLTSISQQ